MNLFQTIELSTQTYIMLNWTECAQNWVRTTQQLSIESECFCSKTMPSRAPPDEPREILTLLNSFYTLAPSNYHLFRLMAHFLRGRKFDNLEQVKARCREFFNSKDKEWYRRGIKQFTDRWLQTTESNGLYFRIMFLLELNWLNIYFYLHKIKFYRWYCTIKNKSLKNIMY